VYGSDSKPETVVGTLIKQIKNDKEVVVRDFSSVRDFIYVDDAIEGLVRLLIFADEPGCHIVNLSTGVGSSVRDLCKEACRVCSFPLNGIRSQGMQTRDASRLILNNDLLFKMTKWKPRYNLFQGLSLILKDH
jgi:UDP-glucose 4-epimerase